MLPDFLPSPDAPREGRPVEKDYFKVVEMHWMVIHGEAPNVTAAVRILASREPGHSETATADRLRRKAREFPRMRQLVEHVCDVHMRQFLDTDRQMAVVRKTLAEFEAAMEARLWRT